MSVGLLAAAAVLFVCVCVCVCFPEQCLESMWAVERIYNAAI